MGLFQCLGRYGGSISCVFRTSIAIPKTVSNPPMIIIIVPILVLRRCGGGIEPNDRESPDRCQALGGGGKALDGGSG